LSKRNNHVANYLPKVQFSTIAEQTLFYSGVTVFGEKWNQSGVAAQATRWKV
jgi:hypothetical protein